MTENEAHRLARNINKHWHARGHMDVRAYVIKEPWVENVNTPGWGVRSNLVNGLPPSQQPASLRAKRARPQ